MKKIALFTFLSFFVANYVAGQAETDLTIGQWKQHLPFNAGLYVTQSDDQVIYSTAEALLMIDKEERSRRQVTKVEGLSRVGINLVKYNRGSKVLMVVFKDGAIDLISEEGNMTLLGVPISSVIIGEKRINDVFMANDSVAYLAGNFGIATLNVVRGLFPNTIRTPIEVASVVTYKGNIYASMADGIYTIPVDSPLNLDDFSNWEWISGTNGFPIDYSAGAMIPYNDKLYLNLSDSLFVFDGSQATYVMHEDGFPIEYLSADGAHLIAGFRCDTISSCKGKVLVFDKDHNFRQPASNCLIFPKYAVEDEVGNIWFADVSKPFRVEEGGGGNCQTITENSYVSNLVYDVAVGNGQVWVATGGLDLAGSPLFRTEGYSSLIDGEWRQYSLLNTPELAGIADFLDIEIHPQNGKIYAGAFLDALVEYDPSDESYVVYQENNSTLQLGVIDSFRTRVAGLAFDRDNNLWVCNNGAPEPLSVLKADGTWARFKLTCTPGNGILKMAIDDFGNKWLITNDAGQGVIVFNEGDIDVAGDNQCRVINSTNSVLPTNDISSIEVDLDGAIWVGTKQGAVVFQCDPFNPDCRGSRPFVEVDGFGANLLEDQDVTAIGIDGANRKWFGTNTGIFVMSPEGNEQIAKFTEENSPLFSNSISVISFNYKTGEAWIGTSEGLISYRSDATLGGNFHESNVLVFPNPVRPEYEGPIAIKGLAQDATVKITDIAGQLVYEMDANGGQAIWNARDYNGRKVNTGVYLVFATSRNASNPDVAVAKILVVN
jgi:hypothetical protein